mgnify:CR=1 FL=1
MDKEKELIRRIEILEEENRNLKNLLYGKNTGLPGSAENYLLSSASYSLKDSLDKSELFNINSAASRNLNNEKYISNLSRNLNTQVNEREVVKIVLQELSWRSGSKTAYYIQLNETSYFISSLTKNNLNESSPFFTEITIPLNALFIDKKALYDTGFSLLQKKNNTENFFEKNKWLESTIESLLIFPVIVKNKIIGIIALDFSGMEHLLTAVDLMIYQTISSIITGLLKRISYESDIKQKKEQYELIIENTPHQLFQLLPGGKIIFANKSFSEFLRMKHDDLTGMSIYDFIDIDEVKHLEAVLETLTRRNPSGNAELITTASGDTRLIKLDFNAVFNESDKIVFINFMGEDITEKKILESELLKTKKRLDLAFLAANDSYWDADLITGEFFYSQNFYRMLGYDQYETLDRFSKFLKLVHPDDAEALKNVVRKSLSGEAIRSTVKFRARTADNEYKWLLSRTMVIETNESGKPSRVIGTNSDITETVRIQNKLKEAQTIAKLGYWEYNHLNKKCIWDSILSEIMGYNKEFMELSESELYNHVHEDDRNSMLNKFIHHIKSRSPHDDTYRCRIKNGDIVHLKQISKTEYNSEGKAVISRGIIFDISELKKTELELVKAKEKAEENNRLKSAFLANMSHEIRTPLNSIIGFSELLSDSSSSPEDNIMYINIIRESSKQLTTLISDIIDISRIDANLMDIEKKGLSINRKIEHLYEIFRNEIKNKNKPINLYTKTVLDHNSDFIISDEIRLTQILSNLLGNAIKFTEQGFIEFGYTLTDNFKYIEFYVKDTGIGIQKKNQRKIFRRFQQADSSIARKYGGTGLGLSISKELSRLLGGKMWLSSEPGEGSTFYFKIPLVKAEPEQIPSDTSIEFNDEKYTKLRNKNILIVDDNTTVLKLLSAILKKFAVNCIEASSGQTAIDIINSGTKIDLILLDIQMPDMDGVTLFNQIRKINPSINIIAQTANAFEEDKEKYTRLGFNGYVSKPFNRNDLIKTISSLI